jgi:hypothetical protein
MSVQLSQEEIDLDGAPLNPTEEHLS